ncbi:MAG: gluconokinase [Synergistetes bacterium]|nr:gluconokinase [Synergistota bacterium]MDW8191668.1 gluconokinase [Synergistota bacterium]
MNKKIAFAGVDIGTTGARCCIFDGNGVLLSTAKRNYRMIQPKIGWVEQNPDEIVSAVYTSMSEALSQLKGGYEIEAIGLSSIFHSIMLVDSEMKKLTNLIIWGDNRSTELLKRYAKAFDHLYDLTGCPLHVNYPLSKLVWFRHEAPDLLEKASKIVMIKEYILWNLSKVNAIDISVASGSGLLNIREKTWEKSIFDELKISMNKLSPAVSPLTVIGKMVSESSFQTGFKEGTPIVIGGGDGALSSLGSGSIARGVMAAMLGTSGAVRMAVNKPLTDKRRRTWCYILDDETWIVGCAINNAGLVMAWYLDNFYPELKGEEDPYREMERWASDVEAGSSGLLFLPFLTGERCPFWNANARGVLFGLALHHDRRHVSRAIIEGVAFRMKSIYEAVSEVAEVPKEIRGTGGLMRFSLWAKVLSSVLGRPISRVNIEEASSFGAAIMAMRGVGYISSYSEILNKALEIVDEIVPESSWFDLYNKLYELYKRLYWKLQEEFDEICTFQ